MDAARAPLPPHPASDQQPRHNYKRRSLHNEHKCTCPPNKAQQPRRQRNRSHNTETTSATVPVHKTLTSNNLIRRQQATPDRSRLQHITPAAGAKYQRWTNTTIERMSKQAGNKTSGTCPNLYNAKRDNELRKTHTLNIRVLLLLIK